MDKNIKLPRIPKVGGYTTGDSDEYTSEYTYEDYVAAMKSYPTATDGMVEYDMIKNILQYFKNNPDIAESNGISTEMLGMFIS